MAPITGVQRPMQMQTPAQTKRMCAAQRGGEGLGNIIEIRSLMREPPTASRKSRRPRPGGPLGKVEYKRCTRNPPEAKPYPGLHARRMTKRSGQIAALLRGKSVSTAGLFRA